MNINGYDFSCINCLAAQSPEEVFLYFTGRKEPKCGAHMEWAAEIMKKSNVSSVDVGGLKNVSVLESRATKLLVDYYIEKNTEKGESNDFPCNVSKALTSPGEFSPISTEKIYVIEYDYGCDFYHEIEKDRNTAMSKVFRRCDFQGNLSVTETTAIKINDFAAVKSMGYDSPEEIVSVAFGVPESLVLKECFVEQEFKAEPAKKTYFYYVDLDESPMAVESFSCSSYKDREEVEAAISIIKYALQEFEYENCSFSKQICEHALSIDLISEKDLSSFVDCFPVICDGLENIGDPSDAEDLAHLKTNIEISFNL